MEKDKHITIKKQFNGIIYILKGAPHSLRYSRSGRLLIAMLSIVLVWPGIYPAPWSASYRK